VDDDGTRSVVVAMQVVAEFPVITAKLAAILVDLGQIPPHLAETPGRQITAQFAVITPQLCAVLMNLPQVGADFPTMGVAELAGRRGRWDKKRRRRVRPPLQPSERTYEP
jgi:hypothetical protein